MQIYEQVDVDNVPAAHNIIKNETPAQAFSSKFCELFQPLTLLKIRPTTGVFL